MAGANQAPAAAFGWPPLLTTKLAAAFVGKTRWAIYRLVEAGSLAPRGRMGRELVFAREDLERCMLGPASNGAPGPASSTRSTSKTATAEALARLKLLRGGAR
jgi:hypothetical protein